MSDLKLTLDDEFNFAVSQVKDMPVSKGPSDSEKLVMYSLYKQATIGDCDTNRPSLFSPVDRAKWDAWNARKGMSKKDAKMAYCDEFLKLSDRYL